MCTKAAWVVVVVLPITDTLIRMFSCVPTRVQSEHRHSGTVVKLNIMHYLFN